MSPRRTNVDCPLIHLLTLAMKQLSLPFPFLTYCGRYFESLNSSVQKLVSGLRGANGHRDWMVLMNSISIS